MRLIGLEKTTRIPFYRNVDVKALIPLEMTYYKFMFSLSSLVPALAGGDPKAAPARSKGGRHRERDRGGTKGMHMKMDFILDILFARQIIH